MTNQTQVVEDPYELIKNVTSKAQAQEIIESYLLKHCSYALFLQHLVIEKGYEFEDVKSELKKRNIKVEPIIHLPRWVFGCSERTVDDRLKIVNVNSLLLEHAQERELLHTAAHETITLAKEELNVETK